MAGVFTEKPTSYQMVITETIVSVTSTSAQLVAANSSRKFLAWMVIGANDVGITKTNPAVFASAMIFPSNGVSKQGGSQTFDSKVPTGAFYAICNTGLSSSVIVWEGQ